MSDRVEGEVAPHCANGHLVPVDAAFCPRCGAPKSLSDNLTTAASASSDAGPSASVLEQTVVLSSPADGQDARMESAGAGPDAHAAPTDNVTADEYVQPKRRGRRLSMSLGLVGLLLVIAGSAGWWFVLRETNEDRYLVELRTTGLIKGLGNDDSALAQGKAFCAGLNSGEENVGFKRQRVAVKHLCPEFLDGFLVIPTPEEQAANLTKQLRANGLGGKFPSDAAAVAHAETVCAGLDEGGAQQGPEEDAIAVSVYCDKYAAGFKTLRPIKVAGTFTLVDTSGSYYFQSIEGGTSSCYGASGYSDIGPGTEVVVKNDEGTTLTTTNLGTGSGRPPVTCEFKFKFTVMDGESGYTVSVGRRGDLHFTAAQLKVPDSVAMTLGD